MNEYPHPDFKVGNKVWYIWRMWDSTFHLASAVLTKADFERPPIGFIYFKDEERAKEMWRLLSEEPK